MTLKIYSAKLFLLCVRVRVTLEKVFQGLAILLLLCVIVRITLEKIIHTFTRVVFTLRQGKSYIGYSIP